MIKTWVIIGIITITLIALFFMFNKNEMKNTSNETVSNWLAIRNLSLNQLMEKFSMTDENKEVDLKYERLDSLTKYHNSDTHPGHFYFKDDQLVMLYINTKKLDLGLDFEEIKEGLEKGVKLKSRVGKIPHFVFPKTGLAFTVKGNKVILVEVFPPTTIEYYLNEIYIEPQFFRK